MFPPLTPAVSLKYFLILNIFVFITGFSNAQVPPDPDPTAGNAGNTGNAGTGDNTAAQAEVPLIRQQGEFAYIRLPDFNAWVKSNRVTLRALNTEINSFAETRTQVCPLGIAPGDKQTTHAGQNIPQTQPFALGYLIYALKGELAKLYQSDILSAPVSGPDVPEGLKTASKVLGMPVDKARERLILIYFSLSNYAEGLTSLWKLLDTINKSDFDNAIGFFPQPAPFGSNQTAQFARMLLLLRGLFGGLFKGPDGETAMINLENLKFKANKWKQRTEMFNTRAREASGWSTWARESKLDDMSMTELLGYYRYFPMWDTDSLKSVIAGKKVVKNTAATLFDDIWAWFGCWATGWGRIVDLASQLTPMPGLGDLNLKWAPEGQSYTSEDKITPEEMKLELPEDERLMSLYMQDLLGAPGEELDTVPFSDLPAQVRFQRQTDMQNLLEEPRENPGVAPVVYTQAEVQPQIPVQQQFQVEPEVKAEPQVQVQSEIEEEIQIQPQVQTQPEVEIQEENDDDNDGGLYPNEVQISIEIEPYKDSNSQEDAERELDISDMSSRRSRPGGKNTARRNRNFKSNPDRIDEEYSD
ncbi:hypothetical protein TWF481_001330 [Arthrobotrys musiformis]|uniref:Uncharacterized protein n=1 Tax=Arthrobotrys musiformis TaxID=47236 RepID=A0AAV9WQ98_9PEZI